MQEQLAHPSPGVGVGARVRAEVSPWVNVLGHMEYPVRAEVSPRVGTRETAGLGPENSTPVRTGMSTSLPQGSAPASPRPCSLPSHAHSPKHCRCSGPQSLPGAAPSGWGHALKQLSPGKVVGHREATLEPRSERPQGL